jgi:hypothetical protein
MEVTVEMAMSSTHSLLAWCGNYVQTTSWVTSSDTLSWVQLPLDEKKACWIRIELEQCEMIDGHLHHHLWPQWGLGHGCTLTRLAILVMLVEVVLCAHHDDLLGGHLRRNCTCKSVQQKYWWPWMIKEINSWVTSCKHCQEKKEP